MEGGGLRHCYCPHVCEMKTRGAIPARRLEYGCEKGGPQGSSRLELAETVSGIFALWVNQCVEKSAGRTREACDRGHVDGADGGRALEHVRSAPTVLWGVGEMWGQGTRRRTRRPYLACSKPAALLSLRVCRALDSLPGQPKGAGGPGGRWKTGPPPFVRAILATLSSLEPYTVTPILNV